ncbi:hypothetical protein WJX73_006281 [Symbiochloris irregularis]|uniref:F-box domain-containing protein n=1 Tax=Symbiochloris irregularis TaxID=706552 RepID=A0AAW1Q3I0_9CHLO
MQSSVNRPDWTQLPSELLLEVFSNLQLRDLLQAESSCRSWMQALKCPQAQKVWRDITVSLNERLRSRVSRDGTRARCSDSELWWPTCRWEASLTEKVAEESSARLAVLALGCGRLRQD